MRYILLLAALICSAIALHAQTPRESYTGAFDQALTERFDADGPGGAVLVAQAGKVLYSKALGKADLSTGAALTTEHRFRIGSVTKQFTAVAILQLEEAGKLKLSDELQRYVEFPQKEKPITIRDLLTHTSGIPNLTDGPAYTPDAYAKDIALPDLIKLIADAPLEFEPGTQWSYSNSGYILLSAIIEKVSGQSWAQYARQNLFKPAGMTNTTAELDEDATGQAIGYAPGEQGWQTANPVSMSWPLGAGNIRSTVADLWKWNSSVFTGKLVPNSRIAEAHRPVALADGRTEAYGYGWMFNRVQGSPTIEHSGGIDGFVSASMYLPEEDLYVAVLVNRESNDATTLAAELAAIALGKPYGGPKVALSPEQAQAYTGVYLDTDSVERYITAKGGELRSMREGGSPRPLRYVGNDRFIIEGDVIVLVFQRSAGKVTGARFLTRERELQLTRTDKPLPTPRRPIALRNADLLPYVGEFELMPGFTLTFRADGDRLFVLPTRQAEIEVFGEAPHKFFLTVVDATIEFVPEADGTVQRLIFNQGGSMEGKRVK